LIPLKVYDSIPGLQDLQDDDGLLELSEDMEICYLGIIYKGYFLLFDDGLEPLIINGKLKEVIGDALIEKADIRVRINENYVLPISEHNTCLLQEKLWYGPSFSTTALSKAYIRHVTSHYIKGEEFTLSGSPPHRVEFWLYGEPPERTIEIEDLVLFNLPSKGVHTKFCHAILDIKSSIFSHFDLAIINYSDSDYLKRIEKSINERGRKHNKTKLLRIDNVSMGVFKSAVIHYHKYNPLIGEYFSGNIGTDKEVQNSIGIIADHNLRTLRSRAN
jgi:hypothetical protein